MNRTDKFLMVGFAILLAAIVWVSIGGKWYRAGAQAEVYRREGIEMTQWEVFIGVKPAERTVNLK